MRVVWRNPSDSTKHRACHKTSFDFHSRPFSMLHHAFLRQRNIPRTPCSLMISSTTPQSPPKPDRFYIRTYPTPHPIQPPSNPHSSAPSKQREHGRKRAPPLLTGITHRVCKGLIRRRTGVATQVPLKERGNDGERYQKQHL